MKPPGRETHPSTPQAVVKLPQLSDRLLSVSLTAILGLSYYAFGFSRKLGGAKMPTVERRPISQKTVTLTSPSKKPPKWQSLVSEMESLSSDSVLALTPDEGDSMRALKVQVSRASKAAG